MEYHELPVFYSFLQKKDKNETTDIEELRIQVESIEGYFSKAVTCFNPNKPISKLLKSK